MGKLDLEALKNLNIPEYKPDPKEEVETITEEETKDLKEEVIQEVESLEEFEKGFKEEESEEEPGITSTPETKTPEVKVEDQPETEISVIKGLSEWAKSEGLFEYTDEEFEDSPEFLKSKFDQVADKRADEKLKEYPEVIHELAKNYKEGVPLDELIYSKSREIEYSTITEDKLAEDKELQKKLVTDYLINQDFTDEEISKKLVKLEDSLMLEDESFTALKKLKIFETKYQEKLIQDTKQRNLEAQEDYNKKVKSIENEILGMDEIIPGVPISKEDKKKVFEGYTKPDRQGKTQLMKAIEKDPKLWYKFTQFALLMDGNLDKVKSKIKTDVTKNNIKVVQTYKETPGLGALNLEKIKRAIEISKKQNQKI